MKIKKLRENIWTEIIIEDLENREEFSIINGICASSVGCFTGYAICPYFTCETMFCVFGGCWYPLFI